MGTAISAKPMKSAVIVCLAICVIAVGQPQPLGDAQAALDRKDYDTALKLLRPLAQNGDPGAQTLLGGMYAMGAGVTKNDSEALNWFRKGAAQGVPEAEYQLGIANLLGQGTAKNAKE